MRGSHTGELVFNNVEVSAQNVMGGVGRKWPKRPIPSLLPCEMNSG
jgi:hypothetical protein